jgi:hypothetical protein
MSGGTFGTNWLDLASTSNRCNRIYVQGFMDISGGNLIVRNNNLYLTQGDASINGNLLLGYDASLNRRLFVGSDASFGGNLYIAKNVGLGVSGSFGVYDVCNNAQMVVDISGGVNLRGPVMGGLTLPDQSVLMTATPPLDLSNNFGTVWKQAISDSRSWYGIGISATGQYQSAVVDGGYIYTSNNYGVTWSQATSDATRYWRSVSLSANGQYQTAVVATGYIYTSNNYGVTWKQATSDSTRNWIGVSMSSTGQYQTAVVTGGYIYRSNNYGVTWSQATSDATRSWYGIGISATGQYQSAVVDSGYIYTSNNYGVTWSQATSDATRYWRSVSLSANGQYQTAVAFVGYIYTSNDYGVTWKQATSDATRNWFAVSMSANGQYQTAGVYSYGYIYTSNNYGVTWRQATSDAARHWIGVSVSATGQYQSAVDQYSYIYTSVTPYNDLVAQNSLISYCDASFNKRLFVGGECMITGNTTLGNGTTSNLLISPGYYYNGSAFASNSNAVAFDLASTGMISFSDNVIFTGGNVGIGTTNPTTKLEIDGQTNIKGSNVINFGSDQTKQGDAGKIGYGTFDSGALCIVGAGTGTRTVKIWDNVTVVGSLSPGSLSTGTIGCNKVSINNGGQCLYCYNSGGADVVQISKENTSSNYCIRLDNAGGTSQGRFIAFYNDGNQVGRITSSSTSGMTLTTTSDYRLKQNITELTNAEYIIEHLKPVSFEFKAEPGIRVDGFIAHELQEFIPGCVDGTKDGVDADGNPDYQGIDTRYMVPYIVKMLQIQNKRISDLQQEVSELKQLINNK